MVQIYKDLVFFKTQGRIYKDVRFVEFKAELQPGQLHIYYNFVVVVMGVICMDNVGG